LEHLDVDESKYKEFIVYSTVTTSQHITNLSISIITK
jgi:hypothetical protein